MCLYIIRLILSRELAESELTLFEELLFILILKGVNGSHKELHFGTSSLHIFLYTLHELLILKEQIPLRVIADAQRMVGGVFLTL